ncbi:SCAN domain-containing protein 1 [Orycteropus afer afer]|uniref:SCAN domain-containing protein 1 n=1 Tax=Orycteropus afer afer TaxID=1230840 RepID=A0A8B6ZB11_ORYAF|nr:SCAN domain-containing protein 1 [Orycteropus afer afer]
MAATEEILAAIGASGSPAAPPEKQDGAGPSSYPGRSSAGSFSIPGASPPVPEPTSPNAAVPDAIPTPPVAASAPLADAAPRSLPGPGYSRPGPETFRQRFRQFRYQDAAGPREAFRQLRELSRQWLRPDIRTKEQIVEMLVQEQLLAILPEAARARRRGRRTDVRITG